MILCTAVVNGLTHPCLATYLKSVVWTCDTFENNFRMKHKFLNYLKKSCRCSFNEKFFQLLLLLKSYHQNGHAVLAGAGMNGFNPSNAEATFVQSTRTQRFLKTI